MEKLITTKQAADVLGVSAQTVTKLVRLGELRVVRIGSRTLFRPLDIYDYVERHAQLVEAVAS